MFGKVLDAPLINTEERFFDANKKYNTLCIT